MKLSACRHCGAEVGWIITRATGAHMPIDPTPIERGNVICQVDADGVIRGVVRAPSDTSPRPPGIAYMPHFVTCTVLARHRPTRPTKPPKPTPPVAPSLFEPRRT